DRLPDRVIHAVGRGEALNQGDRERRFALDRAAHVDAGDYAATIHTGQPRGTFAALAVEERDRRAGRKPQNARGMMRRACRQGDLHAGGKGRRTEKTWRHALRAAEPATMSQPKRAATGRAWYSAAIMEMSRSRREAIAYRCASTSDVLAFCHSPSRRDFMA